MIESSFTNLDDYFNNDDYFRDYATKDRLQRNVSAGTTVNHKLSKNIEFNISKKKKKKKKKKKNRCLIFVRIVSLVSKAYCNLPAWDACMSHSPPSLKLYNLV